METRKLTDLVSFDEQAPVTESLFETSKLWSEVICLGRAQETGNMTDPDSDALIVVAAGKVQIFVDRSRKKLDQWDTALVPAGSETMLRNASTEPAVVLVVTAPPPRENA
jgi:glyoxylate utilization-related uncharacterized protein